MHCVKDLPPCTIRIRDQYNSGMVIFIEILILLVMVLTNGYLAMAEIAIVSASKPRLDLQAASGDSSSRIALLLARSPGRFLSTVQVGITLVGILAGAFGSTTIARLLEASFIEMGLNVRTSATLSVALVVLAITYISLVFGELVPKQIALNDPERVAAFVARPMQVISRFAAPLVALLNLSTMTALRLIGLEPNPEEKVSEEEIRLLVDQGTKEGVIRPIEDQIVDRVFLLGDQRIGSLITPRTEVVWLDLDAPLHASLQKIRLHPFSQFPVARGDIDHMNGFVRTTDLLAQSLEGGPVDLEALLLEPLYVPDSDPVYRVLEKLRESGYEIAFVIDEFGGISGLVNLRDLLEALVGDLPQLDGVYDPDIVRLDDGSYLIDALLPALQFRELFRLEELPEEDQNEYQTLGGFVLYLLGRIPVTGEVIHWQNLQLRVVDMDGLRIDKVQVSLREKGPSPERS